MVDSVVAAPKLECCRLIRLLIRELLFLSIISVFTNNLLIQVQKAAREMGKRAFKKRLEEIKMSEYDAQRYDSFVSSVSKQITSLKQVGIFKL